MVNAEALPAPVYQDPGRSEDTCRSMTPKIAALLAGTVFLAVISLLSWSQYFRPHNVIVHGPTTDAQIVNQWTSTSCGRFCSKSNWAKVHFVANGSPTTAIVELGKPVVGSPFVAVVYDASNPSRVEEAGSNTGRLLISLGLSVLALLLALALWREYNGTRQQ